MLHSRGSPARQSFCMSTRGTDQYPRENGTPFSVNIEAVRELRPGLGECPNEFEFYWVNTNSGKHFPGQAGANYLSGVWGNRQTVG